MTYISFILDLFALVAACFTLYYVFRLESLLKSFTFRFLKFAILYAMMLRIVIVVTHFDGWMSVADASSLMSFFWLLLAVAFYEMYIDVTRYIRRKLDGI